MDDVISRKAEIEVVRSFVGENIIIRVLEKLQIVMFDQKLYTEHTAYGTYGNLYILLMSNGREFE